MYLIWSMDDIFASEQPLCEPCAVIKKLLVIISGRKRRVTKLLFRASAVRSVEECVSECSFSLLGGRFDGYGDGCC